MSFVKNIEEIRDNARQHLDEGPVTASYGLDARESVKVLNEALATEIMCVLRYQFHYVTATGIHSAAIAEEFREHGRQEQEHANRIAKRVKELGGKPEMNPANVAKMSHTEFKEGATLADMIREDLIAERIVIETYRQIVQYFGDRDPSSRRMMEDILANEEEHADDLADLLFAVSSDAGSPTHDLYFTDEAAPHAKSPANASDGGSATPSAAK